MKKQHNQHGLKNLTLPLTVLTAQQLIGIWLSLTLNHPLKQYSIYKKKDMVNTQKAVEMIPLSIF